MSYFGIPPGFVFDDCIGRHAPFAGRTAHAFGCDCASCRATTFGPLGPALSADPSDITSPVDTSVKESITC